MSFSDKMLFIFGGLVITGIVLSFRYIYRSFTPPDDQSEEGGEAEANDGEILSPPKK